MAQKKQKVWKDFPKDEVISMYIPEDPLNPQEKTMHIFVNFKGYVVPRGQYVDMPETLANVVKESLARTNKLDNGDNNTVKLG